MKSENLSQVAIVIPCYNSGDYLQEAVESALKQSIKVELIVIDDGSTEAGTITVLVGLRSAGIRVHRQENRGLSEARNAGVKLTSAEFVVCLDADDLILPDYCSKCLKVLQERSETGFVFSTSHVFGTQNRLWSKNSYSGLHFLINNYIPYSSMFRRKLWEQNGGFSKEVRIGYEDWDFWLGAIERGWKGYHISQPLFMYRKHGKSMLSTANLHRKSLKKMIRSRHPELYSFGRIKSMIIEERNMLPRITGVLIKEYLLRPIYWAAKKL